VEFEPSRNLLTISPHPQDATTSGCYNCGMQIIPADIVAIADVFRDTVEELIEVFEDEESADEQLDSPELLASALFQLFDLLNSPEMAQALDASLTHRELHAPQQLVGHDLHELGDYGINLLIDLAYVADTLRLEEHARMLENLSLPLAVWIARRGGELSTLEPVVNALAALANITTEAVDLENLYQMSSDIQLAVSPLLQTDLDKGNPNHPWRVLLVNRAIIATRSHHTLLMKDAFDNLVQLMPEEASHFFREGMEQMEALSYPEPVKKLVQEYFHEWSAQRTLH